LDLRRNGSGVLAKPILVPTDITLRATVLRLLLLEVLLRALALMALVRETLTVLEA
jgi:hypothetical protein